MTTRMPAVAGRFYPGSRQALLAELGRYVSAESEPRRAFGLMAPHAGYMYSGPVAGAVYAAAEIPGRLVILCPNHTGHGRGLAMMGDGAWHTPLGDVPVDEPLAAELAARLPELEADEFAHRFEHSLEVQLPFLQTVLGEFELVPFAVGDASPAEVAEVADLLWGGPETLIVVSSDLSHYHRYTDARRIDRETVDAILALSSDLDHEQACGATPVNGLVLSARRHGLRPVLLDLRNSGDTAGDRSQVVGYAAIAFVPEVGDARS